MNNTKLMFTYRNVRGLGDSDKCTVVFWIFKLIEDTQAPSIPAAAHFVHRVSVCIFTITAPEIVSHDTTNSINDRHR